MVQVQLILAFPPACQVFILGQISVIFFLPHSFTLSVILLLPTPFFGHLWLTFRECKMIERVKSNSSEKGHQQQKNNNIQGPTDPWLGEAAVRDGWTEKRQAGGSVWGRVPRGAEAIHELPFPLCTWIAFLFFKHLDKNWEFCLEEASWKFFTGQV